MFFRDSTQGDEDFANRWFLTGKPPVPGVKPALYNDSILLNVILGILTKGLLSEKIILPVYLYYPNAENTLITNSCYTV